MTRARAHMILQNAYAQHRETKKIKITTGAETSTRRLPAGVNIEMKHYFIFYTLCF